MKGFFTICLLLLAQTIFAQSTTWYGVLKVGGQGLNIVLHIEQKDGECIITMDSPDQKAFGLKAGKAVFTADSLFAEFADMRAKITGVVAKNDSDKPIIKAVIHQSGASIPMILSQEAPVSSVKEAPKRPQTPKAPFPYYSQEVFINTSTEGVCIAGTISVPAKNGLYLQKGEIYPIAILISGSGPSDRDESIFDHKPFEVIADYLCRQGIAVLRYDDRGCFASTGKYSAATTADLALDARDIANWVKKQKQFGKIYFVGHSEGGMIAPMAALKNKNVSGLVLLAPPAVPFADLLVRQVEEVYTVSGIDPAQVAIQVNAARGCYTLMNSNLHLSKDELKPLLKDYYKALDIPGLDNDELLERQCNALLSPWNRYAISMVPAQYLEKTKIPVLALFGTKDLQVSAKDNEPALTAALKKAHNKSYRTLVIEGANHLFQISQTGSPAEYSSIEQTICEEALKEIADFIK